MDNENKTNCGLNRREVLGTGLTGALLLAGYSCLGLKQAVAAARKSGKPLFSANALNALFPNQPNAEYRQLLAEAQANPVAFVRRHFTLTDAMDDVVNDLEREANDKQGNYRINPGTNDYQDNYRILTQAIDTAQRENLRIVAGCITGRAAALQPGEVRVGESSRFFVSKSLDRAIVVPGRTSANQRPTRPGQQPQRPAVIPQQDLPAAKAGLQGLKFAGTLKLTLRRV
jgi:hypothetical protein